VAAHAHGKEGMRRAVVAGVTSIEHGTYMDDEIFALMKRHGTWYVPTLHAGRSVADKAKVAGYYPEIVRPKAARIGAQIQETFASAYRAGVKIAFGTDTGVSPHGDNAREFLLMVEAGMPAAGALQAATVRAAEALGVDEQGVAEPRKHARRIPHPRDPRAERKSGQAAGVRAAAVRGVDDPGVIEPGRRADLIATPGAPVADINAVLGVDFVMKDGKVFKGVRAGAGQ